MFESLLNAFRAPDIRRRILFVAGILIVFRVPVPRAGARAPTPRALRRSSAATAASACSTCSRAAACRGSRSSGLGVNPYINASIIMQLMTGVIPRAPGAQPRGRVRPQQDQPVHPLPGRAAGPPPVVRLPGRCSTSQPPVLTGSFGLADLGDADPDRRPDHGLGPAHVARRAHHREGHRQRHQLHHLRRHRRAASRPR